MKLFWQDAKDKEKDANDIDVSNLSDQELLDSFKSKSWNSLDEESRIAVIQEMENRNAPRQGREPAVVAPMNDPGCYGGYNDFGNRLSIDVTNVSSYQTLDTYVHESNHAYQTQCIRNGQGYDEHTLGMMQAETARDSEGRLYNYAQESPHYDMQCNELDSNSKAANFLVSQKERYQDDPEYHAYLEERTRHFKEVNDCLQQERGERMAMQNGQVCMAYAFGALSKEQHDMLFDRYIDDGQYTDAAVKGSYAAQEAVDEVYQELQQQDYDAGGVSSGVDGSSMENDQSFGMD